MRSLLILILAAGLCSCSKHAEQDALAQAQSCLDKVSDASPAQASQCMSYVENYDDQQASILKCSILETSGGLIGSKIVSAYSQFQATGQTVPTAAFFFALGLNVPDVTTGYATAQQADTYCQATGLLGLQYVSGAIIVGSYMTSELAAVGGATVDPSSSSSVTTGLSKLIQHCTGPTADCTPTALGAEVTKLYTIYCQTANANQTTCTQISSAVQIAGSDPTKVGEAFLCYLNNQTYNPLTSGCF